MATKSKPKKLNVKQFAQRLLDSVGGDLDKFESMLDMMEASTALKLTLPEMQSMALSQAEVAS